MAQFKNQYSRELSKRKSSKASGSAATSVYASSWYAFETMHFIKDNYKPVAHRSTHEVIPVMEAPPTEGEQDSLSFPFEEFGEVTFATPPVDIVEVETTPPISVPPDTLPATASPSSCVSGRSGKRPRREQEDDRVGLLHTLKKVGEYMASRKRDQFTSLDELVANKLRFYHENGHARILTKMENDLFRVMQEANEMWAEEQNNS